jgi:hypothetical protein
MASRIPVLEVPASHLKTTLPSEIDNTQNEFWPGLLDQLQFYSCQQYAGVAYTFGYEFNRLRNTPGWYWENRFGAHYTWNFLNEGERYTGVNYLHSFDVIRQQGHMTNDYFGSDTAGSYLGWPSGYDKYYNGMYNRLKKVYAIPINSTNGVNTLRNYLYDHLDGSPTGGIACFTTESWFEMGLLPPGTPEAGKSAELFWWPLPDHGLCIVGYNDSIRYDLNGDGQYTNNIDINGDGIVDAKDWEIGGFKFANSWGYWWCDNGLAYVLYSAMASNYENRGVWNNSVYVVEADTGYHPLLTMKVKIDYNKRQRIRLVAGISSDTLAAFPEHTISFPIVNFQGGDHVMNGFDDGPGSKAVELGLDITPLINWFPANGAARLFIGVEERDPDHSGSGIIQEASFLNYTQGQQEFTATTTPVNILDNDLTLVSAVATVNTSKVQITTTELPPFHPGKPYEVQLEASGGTAPYTWSLHQNYSKQPFPAYPPVNTGTPLTKISDLRPYTAKALPFPFPYYGAMYDSIYINFYGFISFEPQSLPAPYITDELAMLQMFPLISPAFSQMYTYIPSKNDGVYYQADASAAVIWWKASVSGHESNSNNNFAVILYPDGRFEFRYGIMNGGPILPTIYTGMSKGDSQDFDIEAQWNADTLAGNATRFLSSPSPSDISLKPNGMLSVKDADSTQIYAIPVMVTDEENLSDSRLLMLSTGLSMTHEVLCGVDGQLKFGVPAQLKLTLVNTGQIVIQDLVIHLKSMDTSCLVTDSLVSVPILNPGEPVVLNSVFNFSLIHNLPGGYPVRLALFVENNVRSWHEILDIPVFIPAHQPGVGFQSYQINDPDGKLSTGESVGLNMTMVNFGDQPATNVNVTLSCGSPYINLIDTVAFFSDFNAGDTKTVDNAFTIQATNDIPNGTTILFTLTATDGSSTWTSIFTISPYAPTFSIGGMVVMEIPPPSAPGNTNGVLDPGDIADLLITTSNSGGYLAASTVGVLTCSSPYITINVGSCNMGNMAVGDTLDAVFNVSVSPDAPFNTSVTFTYNVTSGMYSAQKQFTQKIGLIVEDFETDDFSRFPWNSGGNQPWVITNIDPFEGMYSAKSGAITDNQTSDLSLQRDVISPDSISFYFKTSSEADYDYLKFFIDGTNSGQWAGETPWTRAVFPVAVGNHTFKWQYFKDGYVSNGSDCVWIDYIQLPATVESGVHVSGSITYANPINTPLTGLTVKLKNSEGTVIKTTNTNASGGYTFTVIPPGNYTFEVTTTKPWGGVTAADALLYRKHIANISLLTGIYLVSGDVNSSGMLTASDVLQIQKRIAFITNSFPSGDWHFNQLPFTVGTNNVTQNFNGITYGDANGSYVPIGNKTDIVHKGTVALGTVKGGIDEIIIPVLMTDIENMGAFQFTVHYDSNKLKIKNITDWISGIEDVTVGIPAPGAITFVWAADVNGVSISEGVLCNLHFLSNSTDESVLSFEDDPTVKELTDYDGNSFMPDLISGLVKSYTGSGTSNSLGFTIYPNPNNGKFYLQFDSDKSSVCIKVMNAIGLTVFEEKNINVAISRIRLLNLSDQPDGVYILTIYDKLQVTSQKIVIRK